MNQVAIGQIRRLQQLLKSGAYSAPIFVRCKVADKKLMLGVHEVAILNEGVFVAGYSVERGWSVFAATDMDEISAFRDAKGNPVFLHDFDAEIGSVRETNSSGWDDADAFAKELAEVRENLAA